MSALRVQLRPDHERWLAELVAEGRFASIDDAVNTMLARLILEEKLQHREELSHQQLRWLAHEAKVDLFSPDTRSRGGS